MDHPHPHSKLGMKQRPSSVDQSRLCLKRKSRSFNTTEISGLPPRPSPIGLNGSEAQSGFQTSQDPMARLGSPHRS